MLSRTTLGGIYSYTTSSYAILSAFKLRNRKEIQRVCPRSTFPPQLLRPCLSSHKSKQERTGHP